MADLPRDGLVAIVKRECPTCVVTAPVLGELERRAALIVYSQDDPAFPQTVAERRDDTALDVSHRLRIAIVPTLLRFEEGREVARGLVNYAASETRRIMRHASGDIEGILGYVEEPELIHRDNLVLL